MQTKKANKIRQNNKKNNKTLISNKSQKIMSIYSGFATRQQQETYDHCLNSLLYVLQKRILKFYANEKTDQYKFTSLVQKMYLQMRQMEKSKYLDPKCSYAFQQLYDYLIKENQTDNNATVQVDSYPDNNHKKHGQKKTAHDERSIGNSNTAEISHRRKSYQIPIRTQKTSPEKKKTRNSSTAMENVGKIVTSKSKEKNYPMTIQYSSNMIRKRTPSTGPGSQFIQNKHHSSKQKQFALRRSRNISYNDESIKYRNSTNNVARVTNQLQADLLLQNEITGIIQGYMARNTRSKLTSRNQSKNQLNRSGSNQKSFFASKG